MITEVGAQTPVVMASTGSDMMGGGSMWWIIILFFFFFMNGNGFGGANNASTSNEFQTLERKLDGVTNGICDSTFALNQSITNEGRATQMQIAGSTSSIEKAIGEVRYDGAQNTQKILDAICGNRIADMQSQINNLQLQSALCGVVRYPSATTYNAGCNPYCSPCGGF